jgi:hypothetical protein
MTLQVSGYVDGQPVYYEEQAPTEYSATTDTGIKAQYDVQITAADDYGNVGFVQSTFFMEGTWLTPIWQRTEVDVDRVIYLNNKARQFGFSSLTQEELIEWNANPIGAINYWDWNRIEQNTKYLADVLNSYGYSAIIIEYFAPARNTYDSEGNITGTIAEHYEWIKEDKPYTEELERIRSNVQLIVDCFCQPSIALPANLNKPTIEMINTVEYVQKLLKDFITLMEESFRYSGTFYSGQEVSF